MNDPATKTTDLTEPVVAIVVAAGSGTRLGKPQPKALVQVGQQALVAHSVNAMIAGGCDHIVVVIPDGLEEEFSAVIGTPEKPCQFVSGGKERSDSVRAGLNLVKQNPALANTRVVLVQDAARPFVPAKVVQRVIAEVQAGHLAVVPVIAVPDTIRQLSTNDSAVINRDLLRIVQTPQGFDFETLWQAHQVVADFGVEVTDDAAVVEYSNVPVSLVEGDERAMKITKEIDLVLAEALWEHREEF